MSRDLSPRELQVLRGTAEGWTDQQIAYRLGLALPSVKELQRRVFVKLGARCRTHAVDLGWRMGILGVDR